jgi:hypothetical protein
VHINLYSCCTNISIDTLHKRRETFWDNFLGDLREQQDIAMNQTCPDYGAIGKQAVWMYHLRDRPFMEESLGERLVKSRDGLGKDADATLDIWIRRLSFDQ